MGYDFTGGRIFDFFIDFSMGLTTVQRYCAACHKPLLYKPVVWAHPLAMTPSRILTKSRPRHDYISYNHAHLITMGLGDSEHAFHDIHNHISLRLAIWPNFHLLESIRRSIQLLFNCQIKCVIKLYASKFCMKLDRLILKKIIKTVATRCQILRLKCTKFDFGWGSVPDPAGGRAVWHGFKKPRVLGFF